MYCFLPDYIMQGVTLVINMASSDFIGISLNQYLPITSINMTATI